MNRRLFLGSVGAMALATAPIVSRASDKAAPHVVVVGGGYGGATAAKYLRLFSQGAIQVTLIEPNANFVSCPISNLVLEGRFNLADITVSYDELQHRHGVRVVRDYAMAIDPSARTVTLKGGDKLTWDRLVVSPGIDFMWDKIPGMNNPEAQQKIFHGWKAGPQTQALRQQLEAMPDGGRYIITVPEAPYRCPPAPYERASLVASYFKKHKPKSKVHIFDANADVTSKGALFKAAWKNMYPGIIEYTPAFKAVDVDVANNKVIFELGEEESADVLNIVPPMRAGDLAVNSNLATANGRWCEVDFLTFESIAVPNVHVLGDAIQIAPGMPKSGHMANQHGKTCAGAIAALLLERPVNDTPIYSNTCFSFVSDLHGIHVASVHRYDAAKKTMLTVEGSGGLSIEPTEREGEEALGWSKAIWNNMLA
ncbi:MAG: NAD(P)/FAD-dependent oxidoreductase [Burkholderiaceae bacterium]|nr:NAD(P)/FAD-dependent oxidoreductase [Burkholderiaceae bacterium]